MKLIWTASAVAKHERGACDPRHTISDLYDEAHAEGFIRQMNAGCPWLLVTNEGGQVTSGVGPAYIYSAGHGLRESVAV